MSDQVISNLKKLLGNTYLMYLKTQNYHWNVIGTNFVVFHELFEVNYKELTDAVDQIAERIRQLGQFAPGTFSEFAKDSIIDDGVSNKKDIDMIKDLAKDQQKLIVLLKDMLNANNDDVTEDLLIERLEAHEKVLWIYNSILA